MKEGSRMIQLHGATKGQVRSWGTIYVMRQGGSKGQDARDGRTFNVRYDFGARITKVFNESL